MDSTSGLKYDPDKGIPRELGNLSTSSPPIVVNGVVVVGNVHEQGYYQTRIENIPGDILAYDAGSGKHLWKFHVIPRPGEFGHDTLGERRLEAHRRRVLVGADVGRSRARPRLHPDQPADHRLLRRLPAGRQPVRHQHPRARRQDGQARVALPDRPPRHLELRQPDRAGADGRERSAGARRQSWCRPPNRGSPTRSIARPATPIWPIEERPVAAVGSAGRDSCRRRSRFPTRPKAFEIQELTEDNLIDFTPELRQEAIEIIKNYKIGPLFNPPIQVGHPSGMRSFVSCPSGASNIYGPTVADPENGILYVTTERSCRAENIVPGQPDGRTRRSEDDRQDAVAMGGRQSRRPARAAGAADLEAAVQPHHRDRHEHGRASCGRCRTATRPSASGTIRR